MCVIEHWSDQFDHVLGVSPPHGGHDGLPAFFSCVPFTSVRSFINLTDVQHLKALPARVSCVTRLVSVIRPRMHVETYHY